MPMDVAQRGDICESIVYIIFKYLWVDINEPSKNSDDRWFDYNFDIQEFDIKLQVKSVNKSEIIDAEDHIKYDLKVENNNKLCEYIQNPYRRSILMLIIVPENEEDLVWISAEELLIKCEIYRLQEFSQSNNSNTKRVSISKENKIFEWWQSNLSNLIEQWLA